MQTSYWIGAVLLAVGLCGLAFLEPTGGVSELLIAMAIMGGVLLALTLARVYLRR